MEVFAFYFASFGLELYKQYSQSDVLVKSVSSEGDQATELEHYEEKLFG